MQKFKMSFIQEGITFTDTYERANEKAKDFGIILGTGLNNLYRRLDLQKVLGVRMFKANLPIQVKIEGETLNIDTALLDAGIEGINKAVTLSFKVSDSPFKQTQFAQRLNFAFQSILQKVESKHIDAVIDERKALIPVKEVAVLKVGENA